MNLITLPSCDLGSRSPLLVEMLNPQPLMWLAGIALLIGLVMLSKSKQSRYVGQALILGGLALGAVPVMNNMLIGVVDCSQPDKLAQLSANFLPVSNVIAILIIGICAVGVGRSLWQLRASLSDKARHST